MPQAAVPPETLEVPPCPDLTGGFMGRETPLFELHRSLGARLIDFGGWSLPLHYASQIEEHHAVRRSAGVFDVSHMGIVDVRGPDARVLLETLLANDVGKLRSAGQALYSCMLNESGGVVDDLIVYFVGTEHGYRMVVNGATRSGDLAWIRRHAAGRRIEILERTDLALLAVQGPLARERVASLLAHGAAGVADTAGAPPTASATATTGATDGGELALSLEPFHARSIGRWFVARTGYTGEDGFEVMMPAAEAEEAWRRLNALGVASCGLGARDTLRLEAGLNLYGHDMDQSTHPYESGLGWTVALEPRDRRFVGRTALEAVAAAGSPRKLVGLVLDDRGVLRAHQKVSIPEEGPGRGANAGGHAGVGAHAGEGIVTSGTFSPTLQRSIALARVPAATAAHVQVEIRGRALNARVVKPPFVRHGRPLIS